NSEDFFENESLSRAGASIVDIRHLRTRIDVRALNLRAKLRERGFAPCQRLIRRRRGLRVALLGCTESTGYKCPRCRRRKDLRQTGPRPIAMHGYRRRSSQRSSDANG